MVVYAQISNQSVVKLFMAGVVPAVLLAAGFLVICTIVARLRRYPSREAARASWAANNVEQMAVAASPCCG